MEPVNVSPFFGTTPTLRIPHARVLSVLVPTDRSVPPRDWPCLTRVIIQDLLGLTPVSGVLRTALNGRGHHTSEEKQVGMIELGYVEALVLDIDGLEETNYRATPAGALVYDQFLASGGVIPPAKRASVCTNVRYKRDAK